jgi:hypothetical protein
LTVRRGKAAILRRTQIFRLLVLKLLYFEQQLSSYDIGRSYQTNSRLRPKDE